MSVVNWFALRWGFTFYCARAGEDDAKKKKANDGNGRLFCERFLFLQCVSGVYGKMGGFLFMLAPSSSERSQLKS